MALPNKNRNRYTNDSEYDDARKFERFKEHRHKLPEFQKDYSGKFNKPARRASKFEDESEDEE